MKKLIYCLTAAVCVLCMTAAACAPKEKPNAEKTAMDRAKELSEYYGEVPSSLSALIGGKEAGGDKKAISSKLKAAEASLNPPTQIFLPDSRPQPAENGVISKCFVYSQNSVETVIGDAKGWADQARTTFQHASALNVWTGNRQRASRLNYDKQLDKISEEEITNEYGDEYHYRRSQLFLGKNSKINFTFTAYFYIPERGGYYGGYYYEYVEDDYYYYVYNSGTYAVMNQVIYIDLKQSPAHIYCAESSDDNERVVKSISLELDDGKKLMYCNECLYGSGGAYVYGEDNKIIAAKSDYAFSLDLWQASGWNKIEVSSDFQFEFEADKVYNGNSGDKFVQVDDNALYLDWIQRNNFEDRYMQFNLKTLYDDVSLNTYENFTKLLAEAGLSVKQDLSGLFDKYLSGSYAERVAVYTAKRFDYANMDGELFRKKLSEVNARENLEAIRRQFENAEVYYQDEVSAVNEAYLMLDCETSGQIDCVFNEFKIDFSGLSFTLQDSVLHVEGNKYYVKAGLYNGDTFAEITSAEATYANADININLSGQYPLPDGLTSDGNYFIAAYVCNEQGVRLSKYFYPDVKTNGETTFEKDGARYIATVENNNLTVYFEKI